MRSRGTKRSSYADKVKAGARPFVYSQEYQDWFALAKRGASEQALEDARQRFERRRHRIATGAPA